MPGRFSSFFERPIFSNDLVTLSKKTKIDFYLLIRHSQASYVFRSVFLRFFYEKLFLNRSFFKIFIKFRGHLYEDVIYRNDSYLG